MAGGIMEFLRFLWKHVLSWHPAIKIVGLVLGIAFIVSLWYLGIGWWTQPVNVAPGYVKPPRMRPRLEFFGLIFGLVLLYYIAYVGDCYRKSR